MKKLILIAAAMLGTVGCEIQVTEHHRPYNSAYTQSYCNEWEPYDWMPEETWTYYDEWGYFEGTCAQWYVGGGTVEEWCQWHNPVCMEWEFVGSFHTHNNYGW